VAERNVSGSLLWRLCSHSIANRPAFLHTAAISAPVKSSVILTSSAKIHICGKRHLLGMDFNISQTLSWGRTAQVSSHQTSGRNSAGSIISGLFVAAMTTTPTSSSSHQSSESYCLYSLRSMRFTLRQTLLLA